MMSRIDKILVNRERFYRAGMREAIDAFAPQSVHVIAFSRNARGEVPVGGDLLRELADREKRARS